VVGSDARGGQGVMALSPPALCALRGEFPLWPSSTQIDNGDGDDDPELRFTTTGIAVANLRVAVTQRTQQDGEWRDGDTRWPATTP
jgi:hypothetical protein